MMAPAMPYANWIPYFLACWAISLAPGPGAIAAMSAGLSQGFRRGYFATFGLIMGGWTQVLLVGVGLGALIAASAHAFTVLKFLGAGYLIWIGVAQWRASDRPLVAAADDRVRTRGELILRGWAINAVNPKGTVFMLAVVPQFLDPTRPLALQYVVIALTLSFTDLIVMAGYTALASRVLRALNRPHQVRWMNRGFGSLFILAGTALAGFRRSA